MGLRGPISTRRIISMAEILISIIEMSKTFQDIFSCNMVLPQSRSIGVTCGTWSQKVRESRYWVSDDICKTTFMDTCESEIVYESTYMTLCIYNLSIMYKIKNLVIDCTFHMSSYHCTVVQRCCHDTLFDCFHIFWRCIGRVMWEYMFVYVCITRYLSVNH